MTLLTKKVYHVYGAKSIVPGCLAWFNPLSKEDDDASMEQEHNSTIWCWRICGRSTSMQVSLTVSVVHTTNSFAACYGAGRLDFNLLCLGHAWFQQGASEEVDRLLIHEFGHEYSGDHLSEEYHEALCRLVLASSGWPSKSQRHSTSSWDNAPGSIEAGPAPAAVGLRDG